ncbi:MAG: translation initiation factor IF-2 [Clostridia bacterium]|nr:translation initiation factor IF-2 [Clostridia bacterium]
MGKIKIHEIAKKLGLTSKEVLEMAHNLKIDVKSHLSGVDESQAKQIEDGFETKKVSNKKNTSKNTNNKKEKPAKENKNDTPVIIRREVIISEEQKKQEDATKSNQKKNSVGFVERKQKSDYNIVYRNKQTKPMTVSELFGLKKEEPKKEEIKEEVKKETKEIKQEVIKKEPEVKKEQKVNNKTNNTNTNNYNSNSNNSQYRQNRDNKGNRDKTRNTNNNYNNRGPRERNNYNNRQDNQNNRFNNRNNYNSRGPRGTRPLDERGIEKNIKNIIAADTVEKESVKEYNRTADKQRNSNKFNDNKNNNKKSQKSRRNSNQEEINTGKLKSLKRTDRLSNMFDDQEGGMLDYYDLTTQRGRRSKKKNTKNDPNRTKQKIFKLTEITIPETITVKDLAAEMKKTTAEVIKKLFMLGVMATINNDIDFDTAFLVAQEFGITAIKKEVVTEEDILFDETEDSPEELEERPPVVVVMGHVDHGKTSLLDAVKKTNVIEGEAGGITQHIGAYKVKVNGREITFLDTPGHEAFTAMRARGAQITDIAILVVAANDGVKPQTIEAINHAKSAEIPIIVAINKIDLPDANVDKVKQELMQYELVPEEWGGDTIFVPISAKQNQNIDQLLEMVLLQADVLELKANPNKQSKGVVIEARLDKGKGAIATMLVQRGTLDIHDTIVVGSSIGRIRSMVDEKGKKVKKAGPSTPVEIMGLTEVPQAGDTFYEVKDEKTAKHLIERRKRQEREKSINQVTTVTLDNLFSQMEQGKLKVLNLIVKADVQGSVEAVKESLEKLSNDEVKVKVIHAAVGAVNESDVTLAKVSKGIIIAFNVRPVALAAEAAEKDEVEIKQYSIIYQAIEDVEAAMKGMLDPEFEEKIIGTAEIRQTFKISNVGTIAGAYVLTGKVERHAGVRIIRDDVVIHSGELASLKRFKDDAKEVSKGFECGIQIEGFNDIQEGDILECYVMEEIKR